MTTNIDVDLFFDHDISAGSSLGHIEGVLRDMAPRWVTTFRLWKSNRDQVPVPLGGLREAVMIETQERWAAVAAGEAQRGEPLTARRRSGSAELRGASPELTVVIYFNGDPFSRIGGKLIMVNSFCVQVRRPRVAGRPAAEWAAEFFARACAGADPLWGATYEGSEYDGKVFEDGPYGQILGLDFSRFLPAVFAHNFYGPTYTDLIGRDTLLTAPAVESRPVGDGVLLVVAEDPERWDAPEAVARNQAVLDHLGRQYFFAKTDPPERYQAPTWPDPRPKPAPFQVGPTPPVTGPDPRAAGTGGTRKIHVRMILSSLDELADQDHQRRVWIAGGSSEQSSFVECFSVLYDDSGLGDALDANKVVFGEAVDGRLRELDATLCGVDARRGAAEIIDDPTFEQIRIFARRTAQMIRDLPR